jgi:hypothetical protein
VRYTGFVPGTVLLILLCVCVAAVLAALGYLGWRGFRLGKRAVNAGRSIQAAVERLTPGIGTLQSKGAKLAEDQARLAASLASLQGSLARLGAVGGLIGEAFAPLQRARSFFRH